MLSNIYFRQLETQQYFNEVNASGCVPNDEKLEIKFKNNVLYLIKEATEVLDEINYKEHKSSKKKLNKKRIAEELIDVFKFWLNLCILCDISPEELNKIFDRKTNKVVARFDKEFKIERKLDNDNNKNDNKGDRK